MLVYKFCKFGFFVYVMIEFCDLFGVGLMGLWVGIFDGVINVVCDVD